MQNINLCIERICWNIEEYGLYRYDVRDISWLSIAQKRGKMGKLVRYLLLGIENFFPITLRKILKIKKSIFPTTYTFLINALYCAEKMNMPISLKKKSYELMDECLEQYYVEDKGYWRGHKNESFFPSSCDSCKVPTMNMHALARCNQLLIELGNFYNRKEYIEIAYRSICATIKTHNIFRGDEGKISISYYYNSDECTINVNTEFLQWISMLPFDMLDEKMQEIQKGILELVLKEQREDGSWGYYSDEFAKKKNISNHIDCHHSATVLYNLIYTLKLMKENGILSKEKEVELVSAINRGMRHFIDNFFNLSTGKGKVLIGYKRPAGPMQYSEAVLALCAYLENRSFFGMGMQKEVEDVLALIIKQLIKFVDEKGAVPCDKVIRWININTINWGNGAVLLALVKYKALYSKEQLKRSDS